MTLAPKLQLLIGPSGSGETAALLAEYRKILRSGALGPHRRTLWLAPTQAAASDVRDALVQGREDAFLDPGVTTFAGFAQAAVWDAGLRVRAISTLQRRRLLRRVIDEVAAEGRLAYYGQVAASPGFVGLMDEEIADLKRREVWVDRYKRAARRGGPRQRDVAEIYARYQDRLATARLFDAEGLFRAACDGLEHAPAVGAGLELVVVDGFSDFTTAQHDILRLLAGRSRRMVVTLPGEAADAKVVREDLFAKSIATAKSLGAMATEVLRRGHDASVHHAHVGVGMAPGTLNSHAHLERNLFRNFHDLEPVSAAAAANLDRFHIVAASGVQAEIEEIARQVKQRLLGGAAPGEIVVAFRSTREVADRVRQAFDDFGVPAYIDAPRRLAATPLVRGLLAVLRMAAEDWPYRRVLGVVGRGQWTGDSGQGAVGSGEHTTKLRSAMEMCVRQAQLPDGREALLAQIAAWAGGDPAPPWGEGLGEGAIASALAALRHLADALDELPRRADVTAWIAAVERLAQRLGMLHSASADDATAACWTTLADGLRAAGRIDAWTGLPAAELSLDEFVDLTATTAAELPAPEARTPIGRVRVLSAENARFTRPKHLLIGGLSEASFSAHPVGESLRDSNIVAPTFGVSEKLRYVGESLRDSQPVSEKLANVGADEMLLFYQLVTRPTETLTLSYPALDAKAQPLSPSPFLVELERCFNGVEIPRTEQPLNYREHQLDVASPLSRSELRRAAVLAAQDRRRQLLASLVRSPIAGETGRSILAGVEAVASRGRRSPFGQFEGVFASHAVRAELQRRYGSDYLWSPSHLETYAGCPFRFFGERVLKLAPVPELALESDLARRGSLLHDTLAKLYGNLRVLAPGERHTPEAVATKFQELLDAIVHNRRAHGLDAALREIERRQVAAWAARFAQQHDEYGAAWQHLGAPLVPRHFEVRFGPKRRRDELPDDELSTEMAFEVAIGDQRIRFTGQIDRIDVGRVGDTTVFNVIDYKSGAATLKESEVEAGRQLQLPLYAMAVAELLLAEQQAAPLSAGYWSIRGKGFALGSKGGKSGGPLTLGEVRDGVVHSAAAWPGLRERLLAKIEEIIGAIRQGWFPVFNDNLNCTRTCSLSTTCRISHVRSLEKEWIPPVEEA